jgi:hypothetical protein
VGQQPSSGAAQVLHSRARGRGPEPGLSEIPCASHAGPASHCPETSLYWAGTCSGHTGHISDREEKALVCGAHSLVINKGRVQCLDTIHVSHVFSAGQGPEDGQGGVYSAS